MVNDLKMELTTDESKRILRRIELEAYSSLVTALRAQGELDRKKRKLLRELGEQLSISTERHRAEIRRAISDDRLSMIAECVCGSDDSVEWQLEGRRVVPLMPRLVPQTAFTGTATAAANHAASANANISSSLKSKDSGEDVISRKRQRTTSPKPVQKVIMSSLSKTSPQKYTVTTATSVNKDAGAKSTNLKIKQENTTTSLSSVSLKIARSEQKTSFKPAILGGTKQTISMATSDKPTAPLPASCIQAHASVVNTNKDNAAKLTMLKQKPKPKFKPITTAVVKVKSSPTIMPSTSSFGMSKGSDVGLSSVSKVVQAPRTSSSITLSPKVSLSPLKTPLQMKLSSKTQSPPGVARSLDTISRGSQQITTTTPKSTASRLARPLPVILPKVLPPKPAVTRRLTSILPAPPKTISSVNKVILPSTVSSSPPIAVVSSSCGRPPQALQGLSTTVKPFPGKPLTAKIPAVSLTSGPVKREVLSPVSEILTLVTSPSNVPFVSTSPIKSQIATPKTVPEVSLRCEETLSEVKNNSKKVTSEPIRESSSIGQPSCKTTSKQSTNNAKMNFESESQESDQQQDIRTSLISDGTVRANISRNNDGIDLSPLVDELLINNPTADVSADKISDVSESKVSENADIQPLDDHDEQNNDSVVKQHDLEQSDLDRSIMEVNDERMLIEEWVDEKIVKTSLKDTQPGTEIANNEWKGVSSESTSPKVMSEYSKIDLSMPNEELEHVKLEKISGEDNIDSQEIGRDKCPVDNFAKGSSPEVESISTKLPHGGKSSEISEELINCGQDESKKDEPFELNENVDISTTKPLKPTQRLGETDHTVPNLATESKNVDEEIDLLLKEDKIIHHDSSEEQLSSSDNSSSESALRVSGRKRKAPPSRDIVVHPPSWIRGALHLLQRVSRFRGQSRGKREPSAASWFIKPVEASDAPGYHKVIKHPMDFGTIKNKLEAFQYVNYNQFHDDMLLVRDNCHKYNPLGHDVRKDCDEVFMFYEAEYKKFIEKLEKCNLPVKRQRTLSGGSESK